MFMLSFWAAGSVGLAEATQPRHMLQPGSECSTWHSCSGYLKDHMNPKIGAIHHIMS